MGRKALLGQRRRTIGLGMKDVRHFVAFPFNKCQSLLQICYDVQNVEKELAENLLQLCSLTEEKPSGY